MVRVERLGVRSKRAATARRMVCSVFKTVPGGAAGNPEAATSPSLDLFRVFRVFRVRGLAGKGGSASEAPPLMSEDPEESISND